MIRTVAVKAMSTVSAYGLSTGRAREERSEQRGILRTKRCRHHVQLLVVSERPVGLVLEEWVTVGLGYVHDIVGLTRNPSHECRGQACWCFAQEVVVKRSTYYARRKRSHEILGR